MIIEELFAPGLNGIHVSSPYVSSVPVVSPLGFSDQSRRMQIN